MIMNLVDCRTIVATPFIVRVFGVLRLDFFGVLDIIQSQFDSCMSLRDFTTRFLWGAG
jgi:hypothetical protein